MEATPLGKERSRPAAPPERSARPTPQDVPAFEMDSAWGFGAGKPGAKGAPPGAARRGGGTGRIALEGKRAVTGTDQFRFTEEDAGGGKPRVLIAEDDERIRMVYRIKLEAAGYRVREAGDGAEAWKLLQVERFDGLVLDMKMPGYHGLDVLNRMKAADIKIPVVICTAYDQLSEEFAVATHPTLKFLTKPVPPEAILKAFGDLIHGKKG